MTDSRIDAQRKAELLSTTVEHIDITTFDARPIIDAMGKMSFTSRDLARATNIYNQMLEDPDCSIFLVIAGSTSAGGCMDLYAELLRSNMIDGIVATGASIVDMDFFEGLGHKHYQALEVPDDDTLRSLLIDRIYDTYIDEEQLQDCDHTILEIANSLEPKPYSSRAFIREMGKYLVEHGKKDNSLVKLAYEHDVPIFCPAFVDSSAGFGLVKHQVDRAKEGKPYMVLDAIADFRELTDIKVKAGTTGLLMIGGGVPKNFIQDTVVCAEILGHDDVQVHKYAVQITVADVRDGACSSSTLQEAASWVVHMSRQNTTLVAESSTGQPLGQFRIIIDGTECRPHLHDQILPSDRLLEDRVSMGCEGLPLQGLGEVRCDEDAGEFRPELFDQDQCLEPGQFVHVHVE